MRTWSVVGKYPIYSDGEIVQTEILLASTSNGHATFSERVTGDQLNKADKDLVSLALDSFFKSEFADRAMAESVQKIDELDRAIKDFKKFADDAKAQTAEIQHQISVSESERNKRFEAMESKVDNAIAELTTLVLGIVNTEEEES